MNLPDYLEKNGMSQAKLATALGVTQSAISQWLQWLSDPERKRGSKLSAERALEIERATGGQVSRRDLRPDIFLQAPVLGSSESKPVEQVVSFP